MDNITIDFNDTESLIEAKVCLESFFLLLELWFNDITAENNPSVEAIEDLQYINLSMVKTSVTLQFINNELENAE